MKKILKQHDEKLKKFQDKEEDMIIRDALDKIKPKPAKQNLSYESGKKKESGWVDVRGPYRANPPQKVENNQKAAEDVSK